MALRRSYPISPALDDLPMAHLTLLESTVGFVLLIAGIYALLWGLWFLGVRFEPAWPIILRVRQAEREPRDNSSPLLNEYLKRRRDAQASDRCPSCGMPLIVSIDSKGKSSKPKCPECGAKERTQSRLRRKER